VGQGSKLKSANVAILWSKKKLIWKKLSLAECRMVGGEEDEEESKDDLYPQIRRKSRRLYQAQ
jgi:hypothetical protein